MSRGWEFMVIRTYPGTSRSRSAFGPPVWYTPAIPGTFVVNTGAMLARYSNDRFKATPHRVLNRNDRSRYAIPFFCDSSIDWPVAAVPTTVGPDKPPKYPTTYYSDYMVWYQKRNYDVLNDANRQAAE